MTWRPNQPFIYVPPLAVPAPATPTPLRGLGDPRVAGIPKGLPIQRWRLTGDNDAVTAQTLELMGKLAIEASRDPHMIDHARSLVRGLSNKDYDGEAERIFDHVKATVRYVHDPAGQETLSDPRWLLWVLGSGDCDDHATLIASLGLSLGMGAAFRTVATRCERDPQTGRTVCPWAHVYAMLGIPKGGAVEWVAADTAEGSHLGWEPPKGKVRRERTWIVANP